MAALGTTCPSRLVKKSGVREAPGLVSYVDSFPYLSKISLTIFNATGF